MLSSASAHDESTTVAVVLQPVVGHPQRVADLVGQDVGSTEPSGGVQGSYGTHHSQLN